MKELPFTVNRDVPIALSAQIVNGVTSAVESGYYQPGERLPSIHELATELSVGAQTVRKAIGILSVRGEIVARPRSGIHIADKRQSWFTRHLVHLRFGGAGYYFSAKATSLEALLMEARVRLTGVPITPLEFSSGLPHLRLILDSQSVDLALIDGPPNGLIDEFVGRRIRYVLSGPVTEDLIAGSAGCVSIDRQEAFNALIAHARSCGVRHLALVCPQRSHCLEIVPAAEAADITCTLICAESPRGDRGLEDPVERLGYDLIHQLLRNSAPLPDAMFFLDDYLMRGGYAALLEAGVRIPQDLQVMGQINVGHCPVFGRLPTRIEVDPAADAEATANLILDALDHAPPAQICCKPRFVPGDTTTHTSA